MLVTYSVIYDDSFMDYLEMTNEYELRRVKRLLADTLNESENSRDEADNDA